MDFVIYYIRFKNVEGQDIEVQLQDFDTYEDPPSGTINVILDGAENAVVLDTVESDDDVTKPIIAKRLSCGFNSGEYSEDKDVETFSDGDDGRFLTRLGTGSGPLAIPFLGNLVLDDNQEAFQPKPNPVQLRAGEGLGSLKDIPLRESDGDVPVGHYRIIDYIYLCLRNLMPSQDLHVAMNLFELDTDPDTSHAFIDIFLDARTFETDVNERDDCFTVLTKILDAFGCFICYYSDGWYIIRWDEYDDINDGTTILRFANFIDDGDSYVFQNYTERNVDKIIAHDQDPLYEGYRLSQDNALRRFQRRAGSIKHFYRLEQPKEVPCNSSFLRGTVDDDVLPLKTYDPDCWTLRRGVPGAYNSTSIEMKIAVHFDANDYEDDRYLYLTPEGTHSGSSTDQTYAESEGIDVRAKGKFEASVNWRLESDADFGANYNIMRIYLKGNDGSHWLLGNTTISDPTTPYKWWNTSNFTLNTGAGGIDIDFTLIEETEWQTQEIPESPEIPVDGKIYIWLHQINQTVISEDNQTINYADLRFTYFAYINGTYHKITAQENKVTGDNDSRKHIEHEMFIGDSPEPLFKGALKKFDGTNYVLTETWNYYNDTGVLSNTRLGKHIVFQWWNQFRKTRTVIETDIQGLKTDDADGIPGLIHRWKIIHGGQEDKYFRLPSFRGMDFYLCGWNGVFVEMSSGDGDKDYDSEWTFKYIQE